MYLNCHTYFSLRYGTLSPAELVNLGKSHGAEALGLTDIHNTSACYEFVRLCREAGIHPVVGMEFRNQDQLLYIALAQNPEGFREINEYYSRYQHEGAAFPELPPYWSNVYIIYPWYRRDRVSLSDQEFLGIRPSEAGQLLRSRFRHRQDKLVVLQPVTFDSKKGFNTHRLLRAIDHNTLLSKLQVHQQAPADEWMMPPDKITGIFAEYPDIIRNTNRLLSNCSFEFDFQEIRSRKTYTGGKYEDMMLLEKLAREGLVLRYGNHNKEAMRRVERELQIIDRLDFNAYFLITWDFVQYGKSRGFFHVGRGSGANSIVAYCLGIMDVDPIELDLYFERFLNPKRSSPPDFDIDYSWKDRDEVIDYVFKRYGHRHTALLATYQHFKARSVVRELGKVFGLPKREIDKLLASPIKAENLDEITRLVIRYARTLKGFPSHLSIHAGGILISEKPIHTWTATNLPPKGFPITHFDMYEAESIGLHKFDVLSQRGLGHIKEAARLVSQNHQRDINVHRVEAFKKDEKVKKLLAAGKTMGCFYVESPAMRMLLRKLQCNDYPTLVAASSIIRPGVARSGMMQAYIERHNGESFTYLHPKFKELLGDTHGVMVYQEDVIKVAHYFAGLDLAEADLLRRAMSGKFRGQKEFEEIKARFFANCEAKSYSQAVTREVWRQIESFAAYSFSKAHSASFAVESFQSLYLKAHYPLEFMVAVINNFGGFYDSEIYLQEARMWGASVHAPCINNSNYLTCIRGKDIYLGFIHMKDMGEKLGRTIEEDRMIHGPFLNLVDFMRRVPVTVEQLSLLIRAGAFAGTGVSKANLLWEARMRAPKYKSQSQKTTLFDTTVKEFDIPALPQHPLEDAYDEMELLGFPLASPFSLISFRPEGTILVRDMPGHTGKEVYMMGYLVTRKVVRTVNDKMMQFANFHDEEGNPLDATVFPQAFEDYPLSGRGVYLLTGKVVNEYGAYSLEIRKMKKIPYKPDPRLVGGKMVEAGS